MNLIFNEVSSKNIATDLFEAKDRIKMLLETCRSMDKLGVRKLSVRPNFYQETLLHENYSILNWLEDETVSQTFKNLLLSIVIYPYINDNDAEIEEKFINSYVYLDGEEKLAVEGLAVAHFYNAVAISLNSNQIWNTNQIKLNVIEGLDTETVFVKHVCNPTHTESHKEWLESFKNVEIIKSKLSSEDKSISLRDDHGKDKLEQFSKKIRRSPYVLKIVNSLPYNPQETNFIKKCYENGLVEIVLIDTDNGLGIVVQTTGRNLKETEKIASILSCDFR